MGVVEVVVVVEKTEFGIMTNKTDDGQERQPAETVENLRLLRKNKIG